MSISPEETVALVQAVIAEAQRLGLTWTIRPATVNSDATSPQGPTATLDQPTEGTAPPLPIIDLSGAVTVGERIYVISIPQGGNYALGSPNRGKIRVATQNRVANVGTFTTTETITDTVTAYLINGHRYGISWFSQVQSTVANDSANGRIREDSDVGTQMTVQRVKMADGGASFGLAHYAEFLATATGNKTFVGTMVRVVGTGNLLSSASANLASTLYVDDVGR